jgi:hypothetical protein
MYKYSIPSSWYVNLHNCSIANRQTITIPVEEREYINISRKYTNNNNPILKSYTDSETHENFAICDPCIVLDTIYTYFYGVKDLTNTLETIKMFIWFDCVDAVKQFDYKNPAISKCILDYSLKKKNCELFFWIIDLIDTFTVNQYYSADFQHILKRLYYCGFFFKIQCINAKKTIIEFFKSYIKSDVKIPMH